MHESSPHPARYLGPESIGSARCWVRHDRAEQLGLDPESLRDLLCAIDADDYTPGKTFKDDARSLVLWFERSGRRWLIKRYRGKPLRMWIGHLLGRSVAWRECAASIQLAADGLRVSEPVALMHAGGPMRCTQTLVMPYVEGTSLYHVIHGAPPLDQLTPAERRRRRQIAQSVGHQIGLLTAAGWINRDHKPSNLIIDDAAHGPDRQPLLIDPAGISRRRNEQQICRMIANLNDCAHLAGLFTNREALACLRQVLRTDRSISIGMREAIRRIRPYLQGPGVGR